ncbi:peptidoglycan DD-metalloendopeptidase family protein [Halegenticoccus tardaugens]|uniref:peptidoglycan DD-metalloendopeptidase family protein n=1 Tax=Halegenticoccus tardaugens TaxID=2071624 RepID=UPI00100BE151|nr:peptidoglycan DD-metalloendopeptidase family protein [Halegenticoccus tardaugens]
MKHSLSRRTFLGATATAIGGTAALSGSATARSVGLPVYSTDDVNARTGAGTGYGVIATVEQYTGGYVIDGPVDNDGYRWWKFRWNGDGDNGRFEGWSVEDYTAAANMAYPATGIVTSVYGEDRGSYVHNALDIANDTGTPILAAREGTVSYTGYEADGCGYYIKVDHENGYQTLYCHLSEVQASDGQRVGRHEQIGEMGSTGNSTGPHIHFEVEQNGVEQYVPGDYDDEIYARAGLAKNYDLSDF